MHSMITNKRSITHNNKADANTDKILSGIAMPCITEKPINSGTVM